MELSRLPKEIKTAVPLHKSRTHTWLSECKEIAFEGQDPPSPDKYDTFCRTMPTDMGAGFKRATSIELDTLKL